MEYQQQIHIGPGLESICRITQKKNADTADTEKASATQNKSKIGYTRYRESICKTKEKQVEMQIYMSPGLESICKISQKSNADTSVLQKVSPALLSHKCRCILLSKTNSYCIIQGIIL